MERERYTFSAYFGFGYGWYITHIVNENAAPSQPRKKLEFGTTSDALSVCKLDGGYPEKQRTKNTLFVFSCFGNLLIDEMLFSIFQRHKKEMFLFRYTITSFILNLMFIFEYLNP